MHQIFVRNAENVGISAIFIHGRTKTQGSGTVDYRVIREVKTAVKIPVIANGDNISVPLVRRMFDETDCDGVAIARGFFGDPWIFRESIDSFQHGRQYRGPSIDERVAVMKKHLKMSIDYYGEKGV